MLATLCLMLSLPAFGEPIASTRIILTTCSFEASPPC